MRLSEAGYRRVGFNCEERKQKVCLILTSVFFSLVVASGLQLSSTLTLISERGNPSIGLVVVIMRRLMSLVGKVLIQSQDGVFFPLCSGGL